MADFTLAPLPKGRHQLSRQQVQDAQRIRLAVGMAEAMVDAGYVGTSVAAILKRAGVSRQTFYELYEDKHACFLDALDLVGEVLLADLRARVAPVDGPAGARAAVEAYLDTLSRHHAFARLFLVEVHAAGAEAMGRRAALQEEVVDGLAALLGASDDRARFGCRAYVAAVASLVTLPVVMGDDAGLVALRAPLLELLDDLDRRT